MISRSLSDLWVNHRIDAWFEADVVGIACTQHMLQVDRIGDTNFQVNREVEFLPLVVAMIGHRGIAAQMDIAHWHRLIGPQPTTF